MKPYHVELYAGHPRAPTKEPVSALAVGSGYADCIMLSTYETKITKELQREMCQSQELSIFFKERGCNDMLDIIEQWGKLLSLK